MQLTEFAHFLEKLEKTQSRIEITHILTDLFNQASCEEIDKIVYLSLGILAPSYEGIILNLAEKTMIKVLAKSYSQSEPQIKILYKKAGDLGNVAEELAKEKGIKGEGLTVADIYEELLAIAKDSGAGSVERKVEKMANILAKIDSLSARFIARIPVGRLRLGFSEKTVITALSAGNKTAEKMIEDAYNIRPDIGYIAKLVKENKVEKTKPEIGVPVVPMLAQRLNSSTEMIKKMGEVSVEPKFDGLRIFIHYRKKDNLIKIFTRNMNAIDINTFPELKNIGRFIKAREVILDTEAIGIDRKREMFLDFQKTIQRRRKHEIEKNASTTPLQFQVFDILLIDGRSMIDVSYLERRKVLKENIINGDILRIDENTVTNDPEVIRTMHEKYLKMGLEGVVVKRADGNYVSGRTGWNWVKMKEVEGKRGKLSDTVDCVVMGYTVGKGKRVDFGVGQFLAGIKDGNIFKTVTKVGTGLSDEQFRELSERLAKIRSQEKPKDYEAVKDLSPDFWVLPKVVVELAADEITVSPKHTAGLALRFPRLIRFRDDKSTDQITSLTELHDLFKLQKGK